MYKNNYVDDNLMYLQSVIQQWGDIDEELLIG